MKTGKYFKLNDYNNNKIGYGTVDFINLKTIYIKFNSWLLPDNNTDDFKLIIAQSRRKIKDIIYNSKCAHFKSESIVDLDIKTKGLKKEKKSFMNLEVTLFMNKPIDIKNNKFKSLIEELSYQVIDIGLSDKNLFNFYKSKN